MCALCVCVCVMVGISGSLHMVKASGGRIRNAGSSTDSEDKDTRDQPVTANEYLSAQSV